MMVVLELSMAGIQPDELLPRALAHAAFRAADNRTAQCQQAEAQRVLPTPLVEY